MNCPSRPAIGVALAAVLALVAPAIAATADEQEATGSGVIVVPYTEPGEVRAAEGLAIDCAALPFVEGLTTTCTPESIILSVGAYDPEFGERVLPVVLTGSGGRLDVPYRIELEPPPAPAVTRPRVEAPLPVGAQTLIPLSFLGIECGLCTPGVAEVEVLDTTPASAFVGVGPGHLALRAAAPGDITIALRIVDDAGQRVDTEVTVTAVAAPVGPVALHVVRDPAPTVALTDLTSAAGAIFTCPVGDPAIVFCGADGVATFSAEPAEGDQLTFRVVDGTGRQSLGSVTFGAAPTLVAVPWERTASLGIRVPAPPADDEPAASGVLDDLAHILQEVATP